MVSVQGALPNAGALRCQEAPLYIEKGSASLKPDLHKATCDLGGLCQLDQADGALEVGAA